MKRIALLLASLTMVSGTSIGAATQDAWKTDFGKADLNDSGELSLTELGKTKSSSLKAIRKNFKAIDLDQDGWLDLLAVNGSTLEADGPRPKALKPQETFVLWNHQGRFFHDLTPLHPGLSQKHVSRGSLPITLPIPPT